MSARRARRLHHEARVPLTLRTIDGNIALTATHAWAWFALPTQRWAFRADHERLNLVLDGASRLSALAGRQLHLRITSRPYPAASWARALDERTPFPLAGVPNDEWGDHLVRVQKHLRAATMAEKEMYLGVRLSDRSGVASMAERLLRRPTGRELERLDRDAALVAETVAGPGLEGRAVKAAELEWLMRRSLSLGLPAPGALSPVQDGRWETEDLFELTDGVVYEAEPFSPSVRVSRRDPGSSAMHRHVSVLSVGRVEELEVPEVAQEPWMVHTDRLPFPVEWSVRLDVLDGETALNSVQRKLLVVRDMQRHYHEHDLDEPLALERQARQARTIEDEMTSGSEVTGTRVHGWFRIAVTGVTEEQCLERARMLIDSYRKRRMTIVHPKGQYGLLREFIPGEPLSSTAYRRRLPAMYLSAGVPAAASTLGDRRGPYIGHTSTSSRRAVMFDTHFATEVRETSGLVPIVGSLGSGKSVLAGLITYEAARRGITSVMLDPSGPLSALCELPELRAHSRHIDLTTAVPGTLNPYAVVAQPRPEDYPNEDALEEARTLAAQDRKLLALDVTTMLLPPVLAAAPRTRLLLTETIRSTRGAPATSLWTVIDALERRGDEEARDIAAYLRDMAELPLARLFFPVGPTSDTTTSGEAVLTVLTMPGLVLPPPSVPREHWSTSEQLAVPLLHLASWYASRTIYGRPRAERKLVALDETHFLGEWGAGRALFTRLGRDSRKWNTCVLAASQNPADVLGMEVSNFISAAFVGRIEDEQVAADALRMLRVPAGVGYEAVLSRLSPRSAAGTRSGLREFVMRDVDGNVDRMRVDLDHLPHVLSALDTTAPSAGHEIAELGPPQRALGAGGYDLSGAPRLPRSRAEDGATPRQSGTPTPQVTRTIDLTDGARISAAEQVAEHAGAGAARGQNLLEDNGSAAAARSYNPFVDDVRPGGPTGHPRQKDAGNRSAPENRGPRTAHPAGDAPEPPRPQARQTADAGTAGAGADGTGERATSGNGTAGNGMTHGRAEANGGRAEANGGGSGADEPGSRAHNGWPELPVHVLVTETGTMHVIDPDRPSPATGTGEPDRAGARSPGEEDRP
ncbi:MAG TPA: ATP-binding protein [Kineosporiaceae bacterium]|nr:ATP-binding protein [Kineosporiaceae bacterium]